MKYTKLEALDGVSTLVSLLTRPEEKEEELREDGKEEGDSVAGQAVAQAD